MDLFLSFGKLLIMHELSYYMQYSNTSNLLLYLDERYTTSKLTAGSAYVLDKARELFQVMFHLIMHCVFTVHALT